jgi:hypothetical protein
MGYSTCCGAQTDMEEVGICPECLEHCDFEEDEEEQPLIEELKLTEKEVLIIVQEWYTNGMYADILQNEEGEDLEEICEQRLAQIKFQPIDEDELKQDRQTENQIDEEQLNKI